MKLKSRVFLKGILSIEKHYLNGEKELVYHDENLITSNGKGFLLSILYINGITGNIINTLHVGTGGSIDPQGLFPKLEDPYWTDLNTFLLSVPVSYTTDDTVPSVTFLADVDQSLGNGSLITEAGLFCQSGLMFNVKTFPAISKTSEFSLHISWTIQVA